MASANDGRLSGKSLVLGVSGGIAAYKACDLASRLVKEQAQVTAVLPPCARRLVTPYTFQALTGRPCLTRLFHRVSWDESAFPHLDAVKEADLLLVAPATANLMARLAAGLADDLLAALCLSAACPVVLCPAMNSRMWAHPATQRNVRTLIGFGYRLLGPATGSLACGEEGVGRMLEPAEIVEEVCRLFAAPPAPGHRAEMPGVKVRVRRHAPGRPRKPSRPPPEDPPA